MERPKKAHCQAAKRIIRYVKGTKKYGILYTTSENSELIGYTDSDWAGSVDDLKSTSSYVFCWGSHVLEDLAIPKDETTSNHFGALGSSPPGLGEGSLQ